MQDSRKIDDAPLADYNFDTDGASETNEQRLEREAPGLVEHNKKRFRYQLMMFILCYYCYATNHMYRECWAEAKYQIRDPERTDIVKLSESTIHNIDTLNFWCYGMSQFIAGSMGDNFDLRIMLPISYSLQAVTMAGVSLGAFFLWESAWWYYLMFGLIGIVQSLNFPAFIAIVANWIPKNRRGLFLGLFTTCTNVGNIIGVQSAAGIQRSGAQWGWIMLMPVILFVSVAVISFLFLVPEPHRVGIFIEDEDFIDQIEGPRDRVKSIVSVHVEEDHTSMNLRAKKDSKASVKYQSLHKQSVAQLETEGKEVAHQSLLETQRSIIKSYVEESKADDAISFWQAWLLPNMILYTSAFFLCKLARDAMQYSLPEFIGQTQPWNNVETKAANIQSINDIGAIIASFVIGYVSDLTWGKRSPVSLFSIVGAAVVTFALTFSYKTLSYLGFLFVFFLFGFFVQGVTNTIASTCSADIGKGSGRSKKAVSTVTGIIDGTGSMGASLGQFTTGLILVNDDGAGLTESVGQALAITAENEWTYYLLQVSVAITCITIPLSFIFVKEVKQIQEIRRQQSEE